jgi:hypothetical protein
MKLIVEAPLNNLSFGQVSYNILRELFKRPEIEIGYFPIGDISLGCFEPEKEFLNKLQEATNRRFDLLDRHTPSLRLWHLQGSDSLRTVNQTLLTFYECSEPSGYEKKVCSLQYQTLFSSSYARKKFYDAGIGLGKIGTFECGFDPDLKIQDKEYFQDRTVWTLVGKWEVRKQTREIIKAWIKKYGNNRKHSLNLLVNNPFFTPEDNQRLLMETFGGQRYWNINVLPHLTTNKEVNELLTNTDIDLSGLSAAEGWGLPAFNATALGKWSIVSNHTSHKDWATADNSILVEPDGTIPVYDGAFFRKESPVNHGVFYTLSEEKMIAAMELAEAKAGTKNENGLKLQEEFSWKNSVDNILRQI